MRFLPALALTCLIGILAAALAAPAQADTTVKGIRMGVDTNRTRVVLDLSGPISPQLFLLTDPDRLVVDLPKVVWKAPDAATTGLGMVEGYRYGQFDSDTFRLVFDLTSPTRIVSKFSLPPGSGYPDRFVIDLAKAKPAESPVASQAQPSESELVAQTTTQVPAPMRKPRPLTTTVVIDPGHGGIDPGTTGVDGSIEKDIVLNVALKLRDRLKKDGYHIVMTRKKDDYLTLKNRVAVARAARADLFISLHADSNKDARLKGASVYTLSDTASDAATAELAQKENGADTIAGIDISAESAEVSTILIELTMRETMNQSARFARLLLPQIGQVEPLLKNTHRYAGFRVLKAPDVPSVLVELGQLSNSSDEDRLTSDKVQTRLADVIGRAVDAYFSPDQRADRAEIH